MSRTYIEKNENLEEPIDNLGTRLLAEFAEAERLRRMVELRWQKCLRQYKGQYEPEVQRRIPSDGSKSSVYVRHTKAKCDTLKARLMDLLFPSNNARNWAISPSPIPDISPHIIMEETQKRQMEGRPIPRDERVFIEEIAKERAERMTLLIDDELNGPSRLSYQRVCDQVIRSGILYGTGILKGPLVSFCEKKKYVQLSDKSWAMVETGEKPYAPYYEAVPIHDVYPDPSATNPQELLYIWQSHRFTRKELFDLANNPGFRKDRILDFIAQNPDGDATPTEHEQDVRNTADDETRPTVFKDRYRVLERWGFLRGDELLNAGIPIETLISGVRGFTEQGSYEACVWMTQDGHIIKASLSPVEGMAIPYHFFQPYKDDAAFWSDGLADVIRDMQTVINAAARMVVDNAAIACGPQIAVNVSALNSYDDPKRIYPGKVWEFVSAEDMNNCIRSFDVPSHIQELMTIAERFALFSDEVSMPRYMQGDNQGIRGAGDTASGLSMLMNMASMPIKDMVRNFDSGITEPFIENMYRWNMRFSEDTMVKGDYEVIATGSTSLIAQELMGKRLLEIMSVVGSPALADMTDWSVLFTHLLRLLDLPKDIKLSQEQADHIAQKKAFMEKQAQLAAVIAEMEKRGMPIPDVMQTIIMQMAQGLQGADPQPMPQQQEMAQQIATQQQPAQMG